VEHEKKTFFSLLKNTRSEDGSQGRTVFVRRASERSPLTDTAAEGTRRQPRREADSAPIICFQHVNAAATQGYSCSNRKPPISLLAALFSTCLRA
jgi:hypothetical protein